MKRLVFIFLMFSSLVVFAQKDNQQTSTKLTHWMSPEEALRKDEIGKNRVITDPPVAPIINIAEFQPSQGVIVRYPFGIPVSLVVEMSKVVTVTTIIGSASQQSSVMSQYQAAGANMSNIDFFVAQTDSYWTRDYGPWFIIDGNDQFGIVDFVYNRPRPNDDAFVPLYANHLNVNLFGMSMVHTGGNYMTDGYGISASTDLVIEENEMTATQLQTMSSDYLGINTYHFLEDPLQDYIKHIDCWGKFLAVDKVLIGQVPETDERYEEYEEVANFFANTPTSWGYNYKVYRVFTPGGTYYHTTPYANSLILNDHVFVPQTGSEWDDEAIASYQAAMPGYTIVPIMQGGETWENTDALHCRTHEVADLGMLLIRHYPIYGEQMANTDFIINAEITAYSGQELIQDSILVYYRINDSAWQTIPMSKQCGKAWRATITNVPEGGEVDYYIFAKDSSGRREKHPYIGEYDPHTFTIATSDCPVPTNLLATPNEDKIVLTWDASEGAASYSIYRNNVFVTASTSTTWEDNNVVPKVEYCYQITAICTSSESYYSNQACATIETCDSVQLISSSLTNNNTVVLLTWGAVEGAISYNIYRDNLLHQSNVVDTSYTENYESEAAWCYRIETVCENGISNKSEKSCIDSTVISVKEYDKCFNIYPNPVREVLNVSAEKEIQKISIFNTVGQMVYSAENLGENGEISVSALPKGVYFIQLIINNLIVSEKFVVQ